MKDVLIALLRRIPGVWPLVSMVSQRLKEIARHKRLKLQAEKLVNSGTEEIFTSIYRNHSWDGGVGTVSGGGSALEQTEKIQVELPRLFKKLHVTSVLDIPCGDFWWMKDVPLGDIKYTGADIVEDLIENNKEFENENRSFRKLDLIRDSLPTADLIFVRDCLVHLSFSDIDNVLKNIVNSKSRYLLTTTFTGKEENIDIATGQWRALNLVKSPFYLPEPVAIINENHPREEHADKSLGLWEIADIAECLEKYNREVLPKI